MSRRCSVLMFCPQFRPIVGGAERQAELLAKTLVGRGAAVSVLTPALVAGSAPVETSEGVTIRRFPINDLTQKFPRIRGLGLLNLLLLRRRVMNVVGEHLEGIDVLHTHIAAPLTAFAAQAARRRAVPVICKIAMGGERTDLSEMSELGIGGTQIARRMLKDIDRWIATTEAVRDSLLRWNIPLERISTIPNGVELVRAKHEPNGAGLVRRFLYLGRLSTNSDRDIATVIRAFDSLASRHADAELAIVGAGDLFDSTKALVEHATHSSRILLPGAQAPRTWLEWADALVLPSRREGLSNALLEGMSHGLLCIANDIPQNREVLAGGLAGLLTPVGDQDELLRVMDRVCSEPALSVQFRDAARRQAATTYGIDAVADRYLQLYEELRRDAR